MPFYYPIKAWDAADRRRTIGNLKSLREQKQDEVPTRTLKKTLLLATWNIRDFGNEDKRVTEDGLNQPGPRLEESYYYIAEIISAFDIVAIQEVNSLSALRRVMHILGPSWDYITTDINPTKGGNFERMTFVFDKRKVLFTNLVGQVVTDRKKQLVRTPYYAGFQSGWFKFTLCTVHILYGNYRDTRERIREIDDIAGFLSDRADRTGENVILLGDFNIISKQDATFKPLDKHGWTVPLDYKSNVRKSKAYDQIAFKVKPKELKRGPSRPNAGAFDFFKSVFLDTDWQDYYDIASATGRPMTSWDKTLSWPDKSRVLTRKEYFREWRTWQISDHLPLWLELEIDFTEDYLDRVARNR
jgi:exonuclease III